MKAQMTSPRTSILTVVMTAALAAVASLASAPAAVAAPVPHCSAWVPVRATAFFDTVPYQREVDSALRIRSCTTDVAYTGTYQGRPRTALRITGTAQVWNTNSATSMTPALYVNALTTITDVGVNRTSKFYFKLVKPDAIVSFPTTTTGWYVKGRTTTTAAQAVSEVAAASWTHANSSWKH